MIPTVCGHRTVVLKRDGGSVWYLVTRGSVGVTVVTATTSVSHAGQMNARISLAVDPLGVRTVLGSHN